MPAITISEPVSTPAASGPASRENIPVRPPFRLQELKALIPADCFRPVLWKSFYYMFLDWLIVAALVWTAVRIDAWWYWPIYWVMQGTMFWALFVVGHDCGHGSFSRSRRLNALIGHICHTPLLVPYHGWRISHRTHHTVHGDADREETWYPMTATEYRDMPGYVRILRFTPLMLWLFPFYLWRRSPRHDGSHFHPGSGLFKAAEKWDVLTSTFWWCGMLGLLGWFGYEFGALALLQYYVGPYLVFIAWLDLVTYLHHSDPDVPWYRGEEWSFAKGALSSVDRDYGVVNEVHHNIGTHVLHHLFINIPHYNLRRATDALAPRLGAFYRSSHLPFWKAFARNARSCHYIDDESHTAYFRAD
ncbi:MAG: fatty acid desaturase [bacterium]|nr:fatty acid desaturase [bacterium]